MYISNQKGLLYIINFIYPGLWLFGTSILLTYALRWGTGDRLLIVRLINYLMPWMLLGLIPGLVMAGLTHRIGLFVTLAIPTIIICLTYSPLFLHHSKIALAKNKSMKVMSYNVWRENSNITKLAEVILHDQPDILLLQEISPNRAQALITALNELYHDNELYFAIESQMFQAVISRYPITKQAPKQKKGRAQKVLLETPSSSITVFNVHFRRCGNWLRREHEIAEFLTEEIGSTDGPILLGGDFNTTDQTQAYRLLKQYLSNAHWEAGKGFGFTFPASHYKFKRRVSIPVPLVRIDHIFYSDHFSPLNAGTLNNAGGSDHFPVVADFLWVKDYNVSSTINI
jgi:vancomycin resistance protein VanJ